MSIVIDFKKSFSDFTERYPDVWQKPNSGVNNTPSDVTYIMNNFIVYFHRGGCMPLNELSYNDLGTLSNKVRKKYYVFVKRYNKRECNMFCSFDAVRIVSSACQKLRNNWEWTN